jgi:hypothetical protein
MELPLVGVRMTSGSTTDPRTSTALEVKRASQALIADRCLGG